MNPARRPLRVLMVEDSEDDGLLLLAALRRAGYEPDFIRVDSAAAMREALHSRDWEIILSDYDVPGFGGLQALALLRESGLDLPFIIVSGTIGEDTAVAAMKTGAHDYLMKGNLARLGPAIERELGDAEVRRERNRAALALEADRQVFTALAHVGRELIACSHSADLLQRLGELTIEVLECDCSFVLLRQPEDGSFRPVAGIGSDPAVWEEARVLRLPFNALAGLIGELDKHETVQVNMASPPSPWAMIPKRFGIEVMLYLALRRGDEIVGIHTAGYVGRGQRFSTVQERIARGSAQLASMALRTARVVEELEDANRLKSDFVATMSHELRTPLNILMGYGDLLLSGEFGPVTDQQSDVLQRMEKTARELLDLISATLDLSRLDRGETPVVWSETNLSDLLQEMARETEVRADNPQLRFSWEVPAALPTLYTDVAKLTVILRNLLSNAIKFTPEGSVTVSARPNGDGVEISVSDTGIGILPDVLPIIFEPFRQGETALTRRYGGVGLGLHIVQRLLDLLQGKIEVESTPDLGSTFRLWLPFAPQGVASAMRH